MARFIDHWGAPGDNFVFSRDSSHMKDWWKEHVTEEPPRAAPGSWKPVAFDEGKATDAWVASTHAWHALYAPAGGGHDRLQCVLVVLFECLPRGRLRPLSMCASFVV